MTGDTTIRPSSSRQPSSSRSVEEQVGSLWALATATIVLHAIVGFAQYQLAWEGSLVLAAPLYYAATIALLACYAGLVRRVGLAPTRQMWRLLILVPFAIQLAWLLSLPVLAIDAYSYLVDAAHAHSGLNPYQHAVREAGGTAFGNELVAYRWRPTHGISPYGPVWMNIIRAIGPLTGNIPLAILAVKAVAFGAVAFAAWLIYRSAPDPLRARAFTTFWWNPAVIIEGAGEGHNDAVMIAAVVLSLWCLRKHAPIAAAGALTLAVLTKWIPIFFAPAYLTYVWHQRMITPRTIVVGGALIVAIVAVAYWPLWIGMATFAGIGNVGGPRFVASTTGALIDVLPDKRIVAQMVRASAALVALAVVVRAALTGHSHALLVRACALVSVVYVLLASPLYWAWYILLPIALLALAGDVALVFALTAGSRFVAPLDLIRLTGAIRWSTEVWLTTVIALWIPLAFLVWRTRRRHEAPAAASVAMDRRTLL
jgi:alpha-1,6-mannosyltransferase